MFEGMWFGIILFGFLLCILFIGVPVAFALGLIPMITFLLLGDMDKMHMISSVAWNGVSTFTLVAVPLYILMGSLINYSGMGSRLFNAVSIILSGLPGGLAIATTVACGIMGAICGSSVATAAAIGQMSIREMRSHGYHDYEAAGTIAAGGTLGIIIPPSIPMIIYGITAGESIGKLYIAGVIPGIVLIAMFSTYQLISQRLKAKNKTINDAKISIMDRVKGLVDIFPIGLLILSVVGSIYVGFATATEAAAIGVFGALVIGLAYGSLKSWDVWAQIFKETARNTGMGLLIVAGALVFGYLLTITNAAPELATYVASLPVPFWVIMIAINLLLVVLGCFLETISIIVITTPVLAPIVAAMGGDLIWFGIIMTINMELALITPPVGLNLFIVQAVSRDLSLETVIKGVLPYIPLLCIGIALVMIFPELALWLPRHMK